VGVKGLNISDEMYSMTASGRDVFEYDLLAVYFCYACAPGWK